MKLRERFREAVEVFRGVEKTAGGQQAAWFTAFGMGLDQLFGTDSLQQPFAQHPTVYAAVKAIASNLGGLPLEMFPASDERHELPITDSRVLALLSNPNPDMELAQLLEGTYTSLQLWGDAYWFFEGMSRRNASDARFPTRLELWEANRTRRFTKTDGSVWYEYRLSDVTKTAPASQVIRFNFYNPYDPTCGLAPLQAAIVIANADYKAGIWNRAFFDNYAIPTGLVTPKPGQITDKDAMLRVRDQLEQRHQGPSKRGRLGAVNMALEFLELGTSHKDMDFPQLLDAATERILMVFRVPPTVAGISKNANYQEATRQAKQFWANHLPTALYVAAVIKRRLCDPFGIDEVPYFKTESIKALIEDQESLSNQARNYFNMGVPFEQINERLELGFDTTDHIALETSWLPFSMVNADEQALIDPADKGGTNQPSADANQQNQPGDESTVANDPTQGKSAEFLRALSWRTLISKVRDVEIAMKRTVTDHFFALKREVLAKVHGSQRSKDSRPAEISVEAVMFDEEKAAKDIRRRTSPLLKSAADQGIRTVLAELRLSLDFETVPGEVQAFLQEKTFAIPELVDTPAAERLRFALQEGLQKGETVDQIAARVSEVFEVQRARAERIARTETAASFTAGRFETMKEAGVSKIEWLSARDARVRDSHEQLDGEIVMVGDRFANGLLYPLDPAGPPEEIVNCRCIPLPAA